MRSGRRFQSVPTLADEAPFPADLEQRVMKKTVPSDFPRRTLGASLSGSIPKLAVRLMPDGTLSNMATEAEHEQAYENAEDLAQHLKNYVLRKHAENPDWSREFNLARTRKGVEAKMRSGEWDLEEPELDWVMKRLAELLD